MILTQLGEYGTLGPIYGDFESFPARCFCAPSHNSNRRPGANDGASGAYIFPVTFLMYSVSLGSNGVPSLRKMSWNHTGGSAV